jgi:hypothetical protein
MENVDFRFASTNNLLKFSKEVPTFFEKSVVSPDKFLKFNATTQNLNYVCVNFSKDACIKAQFNTLDNDQLDSILNSIGVNIGRFAQQREDKIKLVAQASSENKYHGLEHGFSFLDRDEQDIVEYFLKNIQCYTGIKFYLVNSQTDQCGHHISICNSKDMVTVFNKVAYAVHAVDNELGINVTEALLMIDNNKNHPISNPDIVGISHIINTIGHELLHTLGLAHPSYKNLKEQLQYRSLVADDQSDESFLSKKCLKEIKKSNNPIKAYTECLNPPIDLQPVDVKGLITIWGESQDYSEYCLVLREQFISLHQSVMVVEEN